MSVLGGSVIGVIVLGFIGLLFDFLFPQALETLRGFLSRMAARESLRDNRVSCGLRAVSGRVYTIGTEWSTGTATLRPGSLTFDPTVGIVGSRQITVTSIGRWSTAPGNPDTSRVRLQTPQGELEWSVGTAVAEQVAALVMPSQPISRGER
jgi:hypothetical protein